MNEAEVRRLVKDHNRGDKFEAIFGPVQIAGSVIWEVWVEFEDEWMTRFVEEPENGPTKVYDTFQALALKLNNQHLSLMRRLQVAEQAKAMDLTRMQSDLALKSADSASKRFTAMVRDVSAAGAFAVAVLVFAYLILMGTNPWPATVVFASIVASGCTLFYGKFILIKIKGLIHS